MSVPFVTVGCISLVAVAAAVAMITRPNPVKGALFLIVNFLCLALLYLILQAQFIAIMQVLVYAGTIMVLFLFVIMLLNLGDERKIAQRRTVRTLLACGFAAIVFIEIVAGLGLRVGGAAAGLPPHAAEKGTVQYIGMALYREFLLPFEVTSMILLGAMVGIIVLARRKIR